MTSSIYYNDQTEPLDYKCSQYNQVSLKYHNGVVRYVSLGLWVGGEVFMGGWGGGK
jgi:hypothetical protein